MKLLDGRELADFIKERQARQVRGLRQAWGVAPKLAIIQAGDNQVIDTYVRVKQQYGEDILIDTEIFHIPQDQIAEKIADLNNDDTVHGIIVQLPLAQTDEILASIAPQKDVDGLSGHGDFTTATATAIDWLVAGYNVSLQGKHIAIVGNGRLVGAPLAALWRAANHDVVVYDDTTEDLQSELRAAQVIVSATGVPGLITEHMLQPSAVVIDAGTAVEDGVVVGDVAPSVRETRQDLTITPEKGGVGPLTVAALFDNVITAARNTAGELKV